MNLEFSSEQLKAEAQRLGFSACGVARACPVDEATARSYRDWIAAGGHADMKYLENNMDKRLDPTLLLPGARSIIVVAMSYAPARRIPSNEYQIAAYAYGMDYHDVMKERLRILSEEFRVKSEEFATASGNEEAGAEANSSLFTLHSSLKLCVDTVPVLERYWAQQAGLGFVGRNHQLIIPQAGSMFFLGEIVTTALSDHYDAPMENRCGTCRRCIDACPTGALALDACSTFDSKRCLSYQTIENREAIDEAVKPKLGLSIYGCDRCQQVCPWNRFAQPTAIPEFQPSEALLQMKRADWQQLSVDRYRQLFKGSAVKRAKYEGLMRNIRAVSEHEQSSELRESD